MLCEVLEFLVEFIVDVIVEIAVWGRKKIPKIKK